MSQPIIKKSSSLVPPKDQLRLMCKTLRGLEADPAILYARWVQQTSTRYVCRMGITATGAYAAYMAAADSPASSCSLNRGFRVTFKSRDTVTSSPVSDPKTGQYNNCSKESRKPAEITSDLCSGKPHATSIAAPPAGALSVPGFRPPQRRWTQMIP
ncbi:hypothetical protein C7212DRAFT_346884 [Tuber magnatum]|uniref:Uncharacterized protein n=1 Tax=Tuber magnatum TaxID=42249 RepID=A0A317SIM6_9PEZI|nr:hypothetical protein C7212DRAFT_346884 [Tuber magnatum]